MKSFIAIAMALAAMGAQADGMAKDEARRKAIGLRELIIKTEPDLRASMADGDDARYMRQVYKPMADAVRAWQALEVPLYKAGFDGCKLAALDMTDFSGIGKPSHASLNIRKMGQFAEDLAECDKALNKK